jgi:hypothetical protein
MVARVPLTPCTIFNGGAGDQTHLLMSTGVVKVPPSLSLKLKLIAASIHD